MFAAPHIILAGEGGQAHLSSGLAVADALTEIFDGASITFIGAGRPVDRHCIREHGHGYISIPSYPAPHGPIEAIRFVAENFVGYWAARWILREQQVSLVVSFGGFIGGILARAAVARGLPSVLIEENAVPSRAARWLARSANGICTAFEEAASLLNPNTPVTLTGCPVGSKFRALAERPPAASRNSSGGQKRLLVLGGSAGSEPLNRILPPCLSRLRHRLQDWHIVHQTGPGQLQAVEERYREAKLDALAVSFVDELAHVLAETDLVVCRSGGTTLAELAIAGVPAVLLPHPDAPDDYQLANAQVYASAEACSLVDERTCEGRMEEVLAAKLESLIADDSQRSRMATAIRRLSRPDAASDIALVCSQLLASRVQSTAA